jgi:uncharacterized iron-regulated membrane protein
MTSAETARDSGLLLSMRLYRAIWRWHFYAGIVAIPFLLVLALTGLVMVYGNSVESRLVDRPAVAESNTRLSISAQSEAALKAVPDGRLKLYVSPPTKDMASAFIVTANDKDHAVAIDPANGAVLEQIVKDDTWYYWSSNIHGTLLMGEFGDRIVEIAAGLGIVLTLTGLYLWWPRGAASIASAFVPSFSLKGRAFWKELHFTLGVYLSILLLFFLVSGLAWSGVWGSKFVQAWSTFPAEKWDNVPLSGKTHASMNHGTSKEVPWALEQTPMPESGSEAGVTGLPEGTPVNLDTVAAFAPSIGFDEQYRVIVPQGAEGVFTISADSMDGDTSSPTKDRTVHIDQYTGKILADVRFGDYSLAGKAMAAGIALHQGDMGWWNLALNAVFASSVVFLCVSGIVMWWKRRPAGQLGAPLYPSDYRVPRGILVIALAVAAAFPLTGIGIVFFAIVDFLLPRRLKEAA